MGFSEKNAFEPTGPGTPAAGAAQSLRKRSGGTLDVAYQPGKKAIAFLCFLFALSLCQSLFDNGYLLFEVVAVATVVMGAWYVGDCLMTRGFTFFPDRIVKQGLFGQTVLPADALVMIVDEQKIRLFHGTAKNVRESLRIRRYFIAAEESADIQSYVETVYGVCANAREASGVAGGKTGTNKLAVVEFQQTVSSYQAMAVFFVIYGVIAIFTVGLSERFFGLVPSLPAYPVRLACVALAVAGYFLLRRLASASAQEGGIGSTPVITRLHKADRLASLSALVASVVAGLGLALFLLFGNMLDFYLFLVVGLLYFFDYYPRLTTWERLVRGEVATKPTEGDRAILPRRSLQISLVLMGALSALSYGESNHYFYANRKDCQDDWGDKDCQEVPAGNTHYGGGWHYYGPRYGSGGGRATRSVGVGTISRGGFGSFGGFHASFGG